MPDLTPLEAAERLEEILDILDEVLRKDHESALQSAASYLRKIASGEYVPVIHGHWIPNKDGWPHCSKCSEYALEDDSGFPVKSIYCHFCGAVMDESRDGNSNNGKDDSHE